eukprot:scaffold15239_cov54-Phaeocystis_antarctica.AAC.2
MDIGCEGSSIAEPCSVRAYVDRPLTVRYPNCDPNCPATGVRGRAASLALRGGAAGGGGRGAREP